jgi:hypothetical protein
MLYYLVKKDIIIIRKLHSFHRGNSYIFFKKASLRALTIFVNDPYHKPHIEYELLSKTSYLRKDTSDGKTA